MMKVRICFACLRTVAFENGECLEECIEDVCSVQEAPKSRGIVEDCDELRDGI